MPRLTDAWFDAEFYGKTSDTGFTRQGAEIEGAQGVLLWCPCGYGKAEFPLDGGRPHAIIVPFANPRNAPPCHPEHGPHARGNPALRPRWTMAGSSLEDLTLSPSVDVGGDEPDSSCWHGYITSGEVT